MATDSSERVPEHSIARYALDLGPAVSFLRYTGAQLYSKPYFEWKIETNPFGPGASYLRSRDGAPAAHCSITPKPANGFLAPGMRLAELGDTHTHPDYQRQGHFAALGKHVIADYEGRTGAPTLIYGLPNEQALPGWTRSIGCSVMENLSIRQTLRSPQRGIHPVRVFRNLTRRLAGHRLRRRTADPRIRETIDGIWSAMADRAQWLIAKDSQWVHWRYLANPLRYELHVLESTDGQANAWVASRTWKTRYPGVRRVAICDVVGLTPADEISALNAFMAGVPRPIDVVHGWFQARTPLWNEMSRHGFAADREIPVIFASNSAYQTLKSGRGWFRLSLGDSDNV